MPVSQPHDRSLATLYPLSIDDEECEGALGITPHVLSQGDLVYCGDPRADDGLGRVAVSAAFSQVRHTKDVALLKQRHDGLLVSPVALVDLEYALGEEVEVAVRFSAGIYRLPSFVAPLDDPYLRFLQTPQQERYRCIPKERTPLSRIGCRVHYLKGIWSPLMRGQDIIVNSCGSILNSVSFVYSSSRRLWPRLRMVVAQSPTKIADSRLPVR